MLPHLLPKTDPRFIKWRESLKKRPPSWNKGFTKENHPSLAKMVKTFKERKIDNFAKWREKAKREGIIIKDYPPLPQTQELAFLIGLALGDGNITKFPRTECLRIALASKYPGLIDYTKLIIEKVFNKTPNVRKVKDSACYTVTIYQKNLSLRLGIPIGNRSRFNYKIPDWILRDKPFLINFLRGLFEAEGSLSIHLPTCTYNFQFSNKNPSLLKNVQNSLELLGYHPEVRPTSTRLRKKLEVENFKQLIQFRVY